VGSLKLMELPWQSYRCARAMNFSGGMKSPPEGGFFDMSQFWHQRRHQSGGYSNGVTFAVLRYFSGVRL